MRLDYNTVQRISRIVGGIVLALGLGMIGVGGYWCWQQWTFTANSASTYGQVIENRREEFTNRRDSFSHTAYRAIVRFTTDHNQIVICRDAVAFNPPSFSVGQTVKILYDSRDPQHSVIDRGRENFLIPGAIVVLGVLFVWGGLGRMLSPQSVPNLAASQNITIG